MSALRCKPYARFHLTCLNLSEAENSLSQGESIYKCASYVETLHSIRDEIAHIQQKICIHLGVTEANMSGNGVHMVFKLSKYMQHVCKDKEYLKCHLNLISADMPASSVHASKSPIYRSLHHQMVLQI